MSAKYMMLSGLILASAANAKEENFPAIDVSLAPKPVEANGSAIGSVDITLHFKGIDSNPNTPLVQLSMVADNVDTVATTLTALSARDDLGVVPLTVADVDLPVEAANDSEAGGLTRQWLPTRRTAGDVIVRYTVPARQTLPLRGAAPPTGFSDDSDAISASGHVLLLMPPGSRRYNATVSWDLSALPSGSRGISSFGEGKAASIEPVSANELRMSYFMSGKIGAWPEHIPPKGFFSAWQGTPPFDPQEVMRWTGTLYNHYVNFFNEKAAPPYGVFMRYNPINPGGGTGLYHSFIITFWKNAGEGNLAEFETTLAHEMYHTFQPYIVNPAGKESSWFTEGLAVFYESRLPLHFGLMKPQDFLNNINFAAARYYSSVMAGLPNNQIAPRFWSDTRVRTLVYDRGMLYFATVDDEVRKVSGGKRSLDNLVLEMLELQRSGKALSNLDWEDVLRKDLGEKGVSDFHAFLGGRMPVPSSGAFGPCFERTMTPKLRYELGFEPSVLTEASRIIRDIVPGSNAEAAGLRNGDEIMKPVPQDKLQGSQGVNITLVIKRGGKTFPVTYLPRGESVDVYQWRRIPDKPDSECGR